MPCTKTCCGIQTVMKSHFCTSLVIQPPAGAWDLQQAPPRVCWAVSSGPQPATRPELRAAKVLWIVGIAPQANSQGESGCIAISSAITY